MVLLTVEVFPQKSLKHGPSLTGLHINQQLQPTTKHVHNVPVEPKNGWHTKWVECKTCCGNKLNISK